MGGLQDPPGGERGAEEDPVSEGGVTEGKLSLS